MSLRIVNLTKEFDGRAVLDGFSFDFADKGLYVIKGKSGVGKTTLLRIIAGLESNYDGIVQNGGIGSVSFAFQEYRLFPNVNAINNVLLAFSGSNNEADYSKAADMLSKLGFSDQDTLLLPHELSGGMKQRVSLARAFLFDAPILLLDEPTKELDPMNVRNVLDEILRQAQERLVIMVSHTDEVDDLTQAVVIDL